MGIYVEKSCRELPVDCENFISNKRVQTKQVKRGDWVNCEQIDLISKQNDHDAISITSSNESVPVDLSNVGYQGNFDITSISNNFGKDRVSIDIQDGHNVTPPISINTNRTPIKENKGGKNKEGM